MFWRVVFCFILINFCFFSTTVFANDVVVHTSVTIGPARTAAAAPSAAARNVSTSGSSSAAVISKPSIIQKPVANKPVSNAAPVSSPISTLSLPLPTSVNGPAKSANGAPMNSAAPIKVISKSIAMGDRNNETKMVQSFLTALKLLTVPKGQDGIFGPRTKAAVILYQKKMHLKQTGIVDAATIKVMAR